MEAYGVMQQLHRDFRQKKTAMPMRRAAEGAAANLHRQWVFGSKKNYEGEKPTRVKHRKIKGKKHIYVLCEYWNLQRNTLDRNTCVV